MPIPTLPLLLLSAVVALSLSSSAQAGCSQTFQNQLLQFAQCSDLSDDSTHTLAWTQPHTTPSGTSITVLHTGQPEDPYGWVGWGISSQGFMPGSDVIVGYGDPGNPSFGKARRYRLAGYNPTEVLPDQSSGLLNAVNSSLAVDIGSSGMIIKTLANVTLSSGSLVTVIWRSGPGVMDPASGQLMMHKNFARESRTIDFSVTSGPSPGSEVDTASKNLEQKQAHAFCSGIGYGVLLPLGVLVARHLKPWADPAWFYLHVFLQTLGFLLGVSGWAIGIWLKKELGDVFNSQVQFSHYAMGMTIFCTSTLQILTALVKPDKASKHRMFWNLVHWFLGYSTIILTFVQVFFGFSILRNQNISSNGWQTAYIVFVSLWLAMLVLLEPFSWFRRRTTKAAGAEQLKEEEQLNAQKTSMEA